MTKFTDEFKEDLKLLLTIMNGKIILIDLKENMPTKQRKHVYCEIRGLIKGIPGEVTKSRSFYRGAWKRETAK